MPETNTTIRVTRTKVFSVLFAILMDVWYCKEFRTNADQNLRRILPMYNNYDGFIGVEPFSRVFVKSRPMPIARVQVCNFERPVLAEQCSKNSEIFSIVSVFALYFLKNSSWWKRRTRLERYLTVAVTLLAVLAITTLVFYITSKDKNQTDESSHEDIEEELETEICYTPGCIHTSSNVLKYMDDSMDPCDDFYQFACGGFLKDVVIPDDKTMVDSSLAINEASSQQLRAVVEEPSNPKDPKPFKLLKKLYSICMNTTAIEIDGYETLFNSIIDVLGGWPVLEGAHWDENNFEWKNCTYTSRQLGVVSNSLISVSIEIDAKESSKRIIKLFHPWLEFSKEQFAKGFEDELVKSYYEYMVDLAVAFSNDENSNEYVEHEMMNVLKFEMELAKLTLSKEELRNVKDLYNPMTVGELQLKYLEIPWLEYLNKLINLTNDAIAEDDMVDVSVPEYIKKLMRLLDRTPKRVISNYAIFKIVKSLVAYLPEKIRDLDQQYSAKISGTRTRRPRWKECLNTVKYKFRVAAGALYIQNYFNKDAKRNVEEMALDIHSQLNKTLEEAEWMDEVTKTKALEKAAGMSINTAYAEELLDNKNLEEFYSELNIDTNNYLIFSLKMELFDYKLHYAKLRQPVIKNDWTSHPSPIYVNAMYSAERNFIYLLAGMLQGVFFDADRPRYMNYGAIGYVIGHEITHGFDDEGRQFDKDGNMEDWWAKETEKAFLKRAKCIIDQYGKLTVPELKTKLNGMHTQGENIADNGGIKLAYSAYQAWVERNEPEQLLPGLNFTQNQLFWISAANSWCSKIRTETLKIDISEDPHCPPRFRVNIPFSNTKFFSDDFDCPVGSNMNPKKKCVVW